MKSGIKNCLIVLSLLFFIIGQTQEANTLKSSSQKEQQKSTETLSENLIVIGSAVLNNTSNEIVMRGEITNAADSLIIEKGFVYSTSVDVPTVSDTKIIVETDNMVFNTRFPNLLPDTLYYIKSFATNSKGTFYGSLNIIDTSTLSNINVSLKTNLKTYPNPSTDYISLTGLIETRNYIIYNMTGKELARGTVSINNKISIGSLDNGLYLLKLEGFEMVKFIKV
tara:strand:+ start:1489 stop:2160 length:672 start_codon:yes stop_codon:yes gene_type:complete